MGYYHVKPEVNVLDLGADPTGTNDSATAINFAIAALPATGGLIYFPPGNYKCNSPIVIGNGSASAISTRMGVVLEGAAPPGQANSQLMGNGAVSRIFAGASMTQLVSIQGPLVGWGLKNLQIDGNANVTNRTILLQSAQWGECKNLDIRNPGGGTIMMQATVVGSSYNTMHNSFRNIAFYMLTITNGTMAYAAAGGNSANICYEDFENVFIEWGPGSAGNSCYGLYLQACDNMRFHNIHYAGGATAYNIGVAFDYTVQNGWPSDCMIDTVDFGGSGVIFVNAGTPGANATKNRIVGISKVNGQPANPGLTNLDWGYSNSSP